MLFFLVLLFQKKRARMSFPIRLSQLYAWRYTIDSYRKRSCWCMRAALIAISFPQQKRGVSERFWCNRYQRMVEEDEKSFISTSLGIVGCGCCFGECFIRVTSFYCCIVSIACIETIYINWEILIRMARMSKSARVYNF